MLQIGDVVKLGRIEYKVLEISTPSTNSTTRMANEILDLVTNQIYDGDTDVHYQEKVAKGEEILCKYCLQEKVSEDPLENLMMFICNCCEGVHYACLKNWMQYKIIAKSNTNVVAYQWKKLDCEICLTKWPRKIKFQNQLHELISIEKPVGPYLMVEKMQNEQNQ